MSSSSSSTSSRSGPIVTFKCPARELPLHRRESDAFTAEGLRILHHFCTAIESEESIELNLCACIALVYHVLLTEQAEAGTDSSVNSGSNDEPLSSMSTDGGHYLGIPCPP